MSVNLQHFWKRLTTVRRGADSADKLRLFRGEFRVYQTKRLKSALKIAGRMFPAGPHARIREGSAARVCEGAGKSRH